MSDSPELALSKFHRRTRPVIEESFNNLHKIVTEHMLRHRAELFTEENNGKLNHKLTAQLDRLGALIIQLGNMYIKVQKEAKAAAGNLTTEERIAAVVRWIEGSGRNTKVAIARAIGPVLYDIESHGNAKRSR